MEGREVKHWYTALAPPAAVKSDDLISVDGTRCHSWASWLGCLALEAQCMNGLTASRSERSIYLFRLARSEEWLGNEPAALQHGTPSFMLDVSACTSYMKSKDSSVSILELYSVVGPTSHRVPTSHNALRRHARMIQCPRGVHPYRRSLEIIR